MGEIFTENIFVKMNITSIKGGFIRDIGIRNFAVLASIATFANSKGEAYPSQDKIGEMIGYSRQTVSAAIREIRKVRVDGEPIMIVRQTKTPKGVRNVYVLTQKSGFSFGKQKTENVKNQNGDVKNGTPENVKPALQEEEPKELDPLELDPKDIVFDNAKQVLEYFQKKYFESYNVAYSPNYARDASMIKSKLMKSFTSNEIKMIIDVAFRDYEDRWANAKYNRVTLGALCSWLGNEALAIAMKDVDTARKIEQAKEEHDLSEDQWEALDNLI